MVHTVVLQLFWLSFCCIGLAEIRLLRQSHWRQWTGLLDEDRQPLVVAVWCFALGIASFLPLVVPGYIFDWPLGLIVGWYGLLLAGSIAVLAVNYHWLWRIIKGGLHWPDRWLAVGMAIAGLAVATDYGLSLHLGATIFDDNTVQIARINLLLHHGLTLGDPFFGNNGVVDPRYSTNLLSALYAAGAKLLNLSALQIWTNSFAFFRLLTWLSLFGAARAFLPAQVRARWSYVVLAVAPYIYSTFFTSAQLPDRIVLCWTMLLLIGLRYWLRTRRPEPFIIATGLIAATHALSALITTTFMAIFVALLIIAKRLTIRRVMPLCLTLLLLLAAVIENAWYPNRIAASQKAFTAEAISGRVLPLVHAGIFTAPAPRAFNFFAAGVMLVLLAYIKLGSRLSSVFLRGIIVVMVVLGFCLSYDPVILGLVGYWYLLRKADNIATKLLIVLLVVFYALWAYNPVVQILVNHRLIPPWVIARYQEFDVLSFVAPIIGLMVAMEWSFNRLKFQRYAPAMVALLPLVFVLIIPYGYQNYRLDTYVHEYQQKQTINRHYQQFFGNLTKLTAGTSTGVAFSNDVQIPYFLPAVSALNVSSIDPETNAPPMSNIVLRKSCARQLETNLSTADLKSAGVQYVIVNKRLSSNHFLEQIAGQPALQLSKHASDMYLYGVVYPVQSRAAALSACQIPYRQ